MHVIAIGRKYICGEELENWNIMEFPPGSLVSESKLIFSEFLRKHEEVSSPKKKNAVQVKMEPEQTLPLCFKDLDTLFNLISAEKKLNSDGSWFSLEYLVIYIK